MRKKNIYFKKYCQRKRINFWEGTVTPLFVSGIINYFPITACPAVFTPVLINYLFAVKQISY